MHMKQSLLILPGPSSLHICSNAMASHDVRRHLSAAWAHFDELYRTLTNNSDRIAIVPHAEELQ